MNIDNIIVDKYTFFSSFPNLKLFNFSGIIKYSNGNKAWLKNNKFHRLNGPAIEFISGEKEWYIQGIRYEY